MTVKGTSSLQRTTYFHLCFHDSMLIFRKQLISLGSGIIEFARVMGAEKMNNHQESMVLAQNPGEKMNNCLESMLLVPDPDETMDNYPESMFWETIENKKTGTASKIEAIPKIS